MFWLCLTVFVLLEWLPKLAVPGKWNSDVAWLYKSQIFYFVSGYCVYKRGEFEDAVFILMEVIQSHKAMTRRLQARVHLLMAKCYNEMVNTE